MYMNKEKSIRFGIVQGRLTQSPPGCLQWFPQEKWRDEFALAAGVGIDYIELIAEEQHNPDNPIWSEAGTDEIISLTSENGLTLHSLCNDYVIKHGLLGNDDVMGQNLELIGRAGKLGMDKFILPLFGQSELTAANADDYMAPVRQIAGAALGQGMTTCLETNLPGSDLAAFLDGTGLASVKAVYDTGNRAPFTPDLGADIRLLRPHIAHVHIKDKNADNENVLLGSGLVDFADVFQALSDITYGGPFTFETRRGTDPLHTAAENIKLVRRFY